VDGIEAGCCSEEARGGMRALTQDVLLDEDGSMVLKPELLRDFARIAIPTLIDRVSHYPGHLSP